MARGLPSASLAESVQFNQLVIVPNALQGLFRRRPDRVGVATRLDVDGRAVRLMQGMRRNHGSGPLWVRVMTDQALLVLEVDDARRVLEGSPEPFAPDPEAKRKGMGHFQPHALTISRGELWQNRRRFTVAALETPNPLHTHAERFVTVAREETVAMLDRLGAEQLDYHALHRAFRRISRAVLLGDAARDDEELSDLLGEMMETANGLPSEPSERLGEFSERVRGYVRRAEPGSVASLIAEAPSNADTRAEDQITHWLFATQDTLSLNVMRTLAVLGSHPEHRSQAEAEVRTVADAAALTFIRASLHEASRLWPTTPLLSRETTAELSWKGSVIPAGTQILISNTFFHRDSEQLDYADRFSPEAWIQGSAAEDWRFNHFSHGPQGCPGVNLALLLGGAVIAELVARRRPRLRNPALDPGRRLPHMLNAFGIRVALEERGG